MIDFARDMNLVKLRGYVRQIGIDANFTRDKKAVEFTYDGRYFRVDSVEDLMTLIVRVDTITAGNVGAECYFNACRIANALGCTNPETYLRATGKSVTVTRNFLNTILGVNA